MGFYCIRQLGCIQSTSQQPLVAFCDFRAIFVINTHNFAVIFAHIGLKSFAMALREGARPDAPAGLEGGQKKPLHGRGCHEAAVYLVRFWNDNSICLLNSVLPSIRLSEFQYSCLVNLLQQRLSWLDMYHEKQTFLYMVLCRVYQSLSWYKI